MSIEIARIVCHYGETQALGGIDLTIGDGEFVALLGPSGSGKTTLLRLLAGLEVPSAGDIRIGGEDALPIPPNKRGIGFVFQHYALFRHMSVARNIAFGLDIKPRGQRPARAEIASRVAELLELVQLQGFGDRYPQQLSGGQRQRVALARALATEPKILLLDEPFGALDAKVRTELRVWLKALHRRLGITVVFVTHDQEEAMELANRVVVMRAGQIEQAGTPTEIYAAPANGFVYGFLGEAHSLRCRISDGQAIAGNGKVLAATELPDGDATAWFRPHDVELLEGQTGLDGTVLDVTRIGPRGRLTFAHDGETFTADLAATNLAAMALTPGAQLHWRPREVRIYR